LTLEDLGNIGDFLGGIGVVVTLVYLAVQIRRNTEQLRSDADLRRVTGLDEMTRALGLWQADIAANPEVADIWRRGLAAESHLDETEFLRFQYIATRVIQIWQSNYKRTIHASDPENWELTLKFARIFLREPGFSKYWKLTRDHYMADFRDEIDRVQLESARPSADHQ